MAVSGIDKITLAAARKYTDKSIAGGGISAGKNCVITDISPIPGGNRVEFQWTLDNGTVQTDTMDVMDGAKGDIGAQGPKGDTGATGAQGIQGVKGDTGAQGPKGDKGDTGATGAKGDQGIQGIKGDKGDDGYPFLIYKQYDDISEFNASDFPEIGLMFMVMDFIPDTGYPIYRYTGTGTPPYSLVTYMNTEGIKGDKGDKGDQGEQGIQGPKGDKGDKGDQGDQGIQGIQGEQGEQGPTGATGAKGDKGDKGDAGEGVPEGGTAGQVLKKKSNTDYDTEWGEAASPLTFDSDDFDVSEQNEVSLDPKQRIFTGTTAEWNALSSTQKAKYTLVNLTDDGETGSEENYSTSEVRTNKKWIDGKPIYRLTFQFKAPSTTNSSATYNLASHNIKQIITEDSRIIRADSVQEPANWDYQNGNHNNCTYFNKNTGLFYFYIYAGLTTLNADVYVTIEYTKTTD